MLKIQFLTACEEDTPYIEKEFRYHHHNGDELFFSHEKLDGMDAIFEVPKQAKNYSLIFDHSGTFTSMGYIEDVDAEFHELHSGDKKDSISETQAEVKPEKKPKKCPKCDYLKEPGQRECPKCGFTPRYGEDVEVDESRKLKKLNKKTVPTMKEKEQFFRCLKGWQLKREYNGKETKDGRVAHIYREKFGVWPKGLDSRPLEPTPEVLNFIKSRNIAYAKAKKK
jgi:hypothetical protein